MDEIPSQEEPTAESNADQSENTLLQRRSQAADSRPPSRIFYSDEHPEIPRIGRASRYSNGPDDPPASSTRSRQHANSKADKLFSTDQTTSKNGHTPAISSTIHTFSARLRGRFARYSPSLTSLQQPKLRRKLIMIGSMLLAVALLILAVTTTSQQSSPENTQVHRNSFKNNAIILHHTGNESNVSAITQPNNDHPAPPLLATSAYLLDADTGATLYASNPSMRLPMLSTTKLMTALVAMQIGNPKQNILITDAMASDINQLSGDSSLMGIKKGETYRLKDLLYGMLLVSGNDAAVAIANQLGGSQQNFVNKMNQEAVKLGLHNTHYMNPDGLLATGHFSSAHDLALLAKASLNVPLIHTISSTREYDIPKTDQHAEHDMPNENQFLWWYPGVDGGKPGWDAKTDFVQVISCTRNHRHLIGVVMHTSDWWTDMRDLLNWGFNTFAWTSPHDSESANNPIPFAADWHYFVMDKQDNTIPTSDRGRYYIYTGYSISGLIMAYFDKHGGLKTFGFPTSQTKTVSNSMVGQQFEQSTIRCDLKMEQCT